MTTPTEQNQSLILEAMKQNRNRILFFLSLVTYCLLAVLATTDRDLFFATGIKLPLLGVELPLLAFYVVMPVFIILTHFNMLYLFNKHIYNLKEINSNSGSNKFLYAGIFDLIAPSKGDDSDYNKFPSAGIFDFILSKGNFFHSIIKFFVFFVLYFLPLITLYLFWWRFNAYQNSLISFLHIFYLIFDTYIVISFIVISFIWQEFKHHVGKLFFIAFIAFIAFIIQITIATDILSKKWHPKLSLSGEQLVNFDRDKLLVLQSLDKEKHNSLALYQPAFDLSDRSFKYADFSNSTLINVNFSNANLQWANLRDTKLQGADLRVAQLQGANLEGVNLQKMNLQGADLQKMNLQGADLQKMSLQEANLRWAKLKGADLRGAQLQGANLSWTELQGADLRDAQLQGADLSWTELQGANLNRTKLQGANLDEAQLQGADLRKAQLQGANLNGAKLQGASLDVAQLQGVYVSRILAPLNFFERIKQQTNKKTDTKSLEEQYKPLEAEQKEKIIAELRKINKPWIKDAIERIKNTGNALDLSKIEKTDSYNEQQAQQWIEQYKKDTLNAKKWTY